MNETVQPAAESGNGQRRRILTVVTVVLLLIAIAAVLWWKLVLSTRETTSDAYVAGHQVYLSAQVAGTVVAVSAEDTQVVKAGDVLVRLDPLDAEIALQRARSQLAAAVRATRTQTAGAGEADALVTARRVELQNAEDALARRTPLATDAAVSDEELTSARQAVARAQAALAQAESQSRGAHAAVDGLAARDTPAVQQARAAFREAWVATQRNAIVAPVSGRIAQRAVQVGRHVQGGQVLMMIVPENDLWIDANFKETQLRKLQPGQAARITADVYGGNVVYHGRVAGVAAGTGGAFALLPAQNASGNWIKVIQRVPVRVALDPAELAEHPLHVGMSSTVEVDIASSPGQPPPYPSSDTTVYALDAAAADAEADAIIAANLRQRH